MEHEHLYDDVTGEAGLCPVTGCWFNITGDPEAGRLYFDLYFEMREAS